jgi:hypothetical protein
MLNSAVDILGYLNLFWRDDRDFGEDYEVDVSLEDIMVTLAGTGRSGLQ